MNFNRFGIRFIDNSYLFNEPLTNLTKTFNIDTIKHICPHHLNRPENQDYIGKFTNKEAYDYKNEVEIYQIF